MVTQEIVEITKKLIEFESIAGQPDQLKAVVEYVADYLKKNTSLTLKRFESQGKPSLVGLFKESPSQKETPSVRLPMVFFHDHLDVVPGRLGQFRSKVIGDRLYGRGASDTKTNGAVLMVLAKELSKLGKIPDPALRARSGSGISKSDAARLPARQGSGSNVGFMFTTDEEIGGQNGTKYLLDQGYKCKFFVTGEPTSLAIVPAHKGVLWVKVLVKGKASHASRPWQGENAALKAFDGLKKLYQVYPLPSKEAWQTTINLGGIKGGDAFNKVMGECELQLDIRFTEKDPADTIINNIKKCFPESRIEIVEKEAMMDTSFDDPWVKRLGESVKKITGRVAEIHKGHGACDGRFYSSIGIPAVEFGTPSKGLHTDEEYVKIPALETTYKILWDFISTL